MRISVNMQNKQQLALSPQLQQAIRLLQLSSNELQLEIQQALDSNPLLEIDTDRQDSESAKQTTANRLRIPEMGNLEQQFSETESLTQHLLAQVQLLNINARAQAIMLAIIDTINDDGYLKGELTDVQNTLSANNIDTDMAELSLMLAHVQSFEPAGVGARDLAECLLIQLGRLAAPEKNLAQIIVEQHFTLLAKRDHQRLRQKLCCDQGALSRALGLIQSLNPRPGGQFNDISQHYVIPDVSVEKTALGWQAVLNPTLKQSVPRLNSTYVKLLSVSNSETTQSYFKKNMQEARWFISSLENRNQTLLKVAQAIINHQRGFMARGELALKPLRLIDIANTIEMHESTISRITTQKYIHTPHGIFELKYFFPSQVSTASGGSASSTAIQALIKQLVTDENPDKPLSDNDIATLLVSQGINVARRTIAKYREALQIPPSTQRRCFSLSL